MRCVLKTGESALTRVLSPIFLSTSLLSVFVVSLCVGGHFMGVLRVIATMLHFLQAVGFSQSPIILPLLSSFRNFAKSDCKYLSVGLSVCPY
jgi:hypothetical protein